MQWAGNEPPPGWAWCDGSAHQHSISDPGHSFPVYQQGLKEGLVAFFYFSFVPFYVDFFTGLSVQVDHLFTPVLRF